MWRCTWGTSPSGFPPGAPRARPRQDRLNNTTPGTPSVVLLRTSLCTTRLLDCRQRGRCLHVVSSHKRPTRTLVRTISVVTFKGCQPTMDFRALVEELIDVHGLDARVE